MNFENLIGLLSTLCGDILKCGIKIRNYVTPVHAFTMGSPSLIWAKGEVNFVIGTSATPTVTQRITVSPTKTATVSNPHFSADLI